MLKRLHSFGFFFAVVVLLAACFEYDGVVHINPDGSGRAEFAYRFPPGLIEKSDLGGKIPLTQKDVDARYRMRAGVTQYRADFRDIGNFKEVRIHLEFDDVASLTERGNIFTYTVEGPYRVLRIRLDKQTAGIDQGRKQNPRQEMLTQKVLDRYKITYKVYLPEKIDQSNAQKVEWNAATWEIPLSAFLDTNKNVIVLEAKTKIGIWERLRWKVGKILG